jgi:hypothetical protein
MQGGNRAAANCTVTRLDDPDPDDEHKECAVCVQVNLDNRRLSGVAHIQFDLGDLPFGLVRQLY